MSSSAVSYDYRAHHDGESTINASGNSSIFTVRSVAVAADETAEPACLGEVERGAPARGDQRCAERRSRQS